MRALRVTLPHRCAIHQRPRRLQRVIRRRCSPGEESKTTAEVLREDDVLPNSLEDCLERSALASVRAQERGYDRMIVEVFVPELFDPLSGALMKNEGDQKRYWGMTKQYCQQFCQLTGLKTRVVYPDAGVSAMLSSEWEDVDFTFSSLNDRKKYAEEDEAIIVACPDPQGVDQVISLAREVEGMLPLVLFNPRLASGDVGIGLAVRRLRRDFLSSFSIVYSLRPFEGGAVFRQHPDQWKVFLADEEEPGRFQLIKESINRPAGEELENIILDFLDEGKGDDADESSEKPGGLNEVGKVIASFTRFMRDITR